MRRILVYSHDTFGLGNIRRMLAICEHLIDTLPDLSILLITGSPVIHSFRLPQRLDYIKLPSLSRAEREDYAAKYLGTGIDETIRLRSSLILQAVINFRPDVILVDKKPLGVKHEVQAALTWAQTHLPATKNVLILRDILDSPAATVNAWNKHRYHAAIRSFYDQIFVLGTPEIFDAVREYAFPAPVARKVRFAGYTRRDGGLQSRGAIRHELGLQDHERLIMVTPGGGEDGAALLRTFVAGLELLPAGHATKSLIVTGPELPDAERAYVQHVAARYSHVRVVEFTDDLVSYMAAADLIVSMGGYNTVCEILSVGRPAIVVPRVSPVQEQLIRAERMARLGLFSFIHPDELTPRRLIETVLHEIDCACTQPSTLARIDLGALPRIVEYVTALLPQSERSPAQRQPSRPVAPASVRSSSGSMFYLGSLAPRSSER